MKKNLLLLPGLLFCLTTFAQPVLTKTSTIGYIGKFALASAATGANVPISTSGAGVTWDCSGLVQETGTPYVSITIGAPTGTTYATDYPKANIHWTDPVLSAYVGNNYYSLLPDSLVLWGAHVTGKAYEIYDDPEMEMKFPFNYNTTVTNTYSKTNYYANGTQSSYQTGDNTITYDGYGTLLLPGLTFNDVVRLKNVRTNSLGPTTTAYYWYLASTGERLLLYETNGGLKVSYLSSSNTGLRTLSNKSGLQLYPNPFTTTASLQLTLQPEPGHTFIDITNVWGEVVRTIAVNAQEVRIEREGLMNGLYFYTLRRDDELLETGKMILQ